MEFHIPDLFTDSLAPIDGGLVRAVLVEHQTAEHSNSIVITIYYGQIGQGLGTG
jgi:hypothetical protein